MSKRKFFIPLLFLLLSLQAFCAETAGQVLDKAVGKLENSPSVECAFSLSGNGQKVSGSLLNSGSKFKLNTQLGTTWYDGHNMWTVNHKLKEITHVKPTPQEVRESNPFSYLDGYKSTYKVYFSRRKDNKRYLVLLNPKNKSSEIKAVEIAINKKTYLPERFIIRDRNDRVTTIEVTSLNLKGKPSATAFTCPVNKMKGYDVVDLR